MTKPDERQLSSYRVAGLTLIPLRRFDDEEPDVKTGEMRRMGKVPLHARWQSRDYSDFDATRWMADGNNVGFRPTELQLVIDVDPRHFAEGDADPYERLRADAGLPDAPCVLTGGGGTHRYFSLPSGTHLVQTLEDYPGVEFKSRGRQVVAAGSIHPETERMYVWDDGSPSLGPDLPLASDAFVRLTRRPEHAQSAETGGELEPAEVAQLLSFLDPENYREYNAWRDLMFSCHDASSGAAREEFVAWSTRDPQYEGHEWRVGHMWDSLRRRQGESRVTYKTLFKAVRDAGGSSALPRASADDDFGGEDVEGCSAGGTGDDEPPQESKTALERMNDDYVAVLHGGKFRVFSQETDPSLKVPRKYWERMDATNFRLLLANNRVETGDGSTQSIADTWLKWPRRRTARGVVFDPVRSYDGWLNMWTGFAVEPVKGDWSLLRDGVLRDVLCDGSQEQADYCIKWAAKMVQEPTSSEDRTLLAFQGPQGVGKGTFCRVLQQMYGSHGLQVTQPHHLLGHFNSHMRDLVIVFADEAVSPYDRAAVSQLKALVTEDQGVSEAKGVDITWARNLVHVVMATNEEWFANLDLDDRRTAAFRANASRKNDKAFWQKLNDQIYAHGGMSAMLYDLLRMDLSGFDRGAIPATQAKTEQIVRSLPPIRSWWHEVLMQGDLRTQTDWYKGETRVFLHDLRAAFDAWSTRSGLKPGSSGRGKEQVFLQEIRRVCPGMRKGKASVPDDRPDLHSHGDGRAWCMLVPSLEECRATFESAIGVGAAGVDWRGEEVDLELE